MRIAFLIFDDLTTLDAIGPFEVLCRIPGAEVMFVGETAGIKRADPKSLGIVADYSIADVTSADVDHRMMNRPKKLQPVVGAGICTPFPTILC